jgi:hypothetical protein
MDDSLEEVEDLPSLLQQAAAEPRYSPAEVALIEERLSRFDELVEAAYREIECLPESAKLRKACRRKLSAAHKKICGTIRFCLKCDLPLEAELARLDPLEGYILAYFPDAELRTTLN